MREPRRKCAIHELIVDHLKVLMAPDITAFFLVPAAHPLAAEFEQQFCTLAEKFTGDVEVPVGPFSGRRSRGSGRIAGCDAIDGTGCG